MGNFILALALLFTSLSWYAAERLSAERKQFLIECRGQLYER